MSLRCAECGNVYKNQRSLSSHISKYHRGATPTPAPAHALFGAEVIEPMLARLTTAQLRTLLLFPEEALTTDLPNLVWFNLDFPANSTVTTDGAEPVALLRASLHHLKKVMDAKLATLTPVQQALVRELVRCVEEGREIAVSPHCPYYGLVQEEGVLSAERMAQGVARTVRENLALPREDWVRTEAYARECLDDSS